MPSAMSEDSVMVTNIFQELMEEEGVDDASKLKATISMDNDHKTN